MTNINMHFDGIDTIRLELYGGANIRRVIKDALRIAFSEDKTVLFRHNDVEITIDPDTIRAGIYDEWARYDDDTEARADTDAGPEEGR